MSNGSETKAKRHHIKGKSTMLELLELQLGGQGVGDTNHPLQTTRHVLRASRDV